MGVAQFFSDRLRYHLGYPPTPCQERLFDTLSAFAVQYDSCDLLVVSGYAGTGKTSAIAAFVKTLKELQYRYVLLAPTGRSAKVLSGFTGEKASTIHKHIYRQKSMRDGIGEFQLDFNKAKDTFFIVDEASLISVDTTQGGGLFGSGDLLDDLVRFVRSGVDDKLIIIGDQGQLPPIGLDRSPALDEQYLQRYGTLMTAQLDTVVRQAAGSGILTNSTIIRHRETRRRGGQLRARRHRGTLPIEQTGEPLQCGYPIFGAVPRRTPDQGRQADGGQELLPVP